MSDPLCKKLAGDGANQEQKIEIVPRMHLRCSSRRRPRPIGSHREAKQIDVAKVTLTLKQDKDHAVQAHMTMMTIKPPPSGNIPKVWKPGRWR